MIAIRNGVFILHPEPPEGMDINVATQFVLDTLHTILPQHMQQREMPGLCFYREKAQREGNDGFMTVILSPSLPLMGRGQNYNNMLEPH